MKHAEARSAALEALQHGVSAVSSAWDDSIAKWLCVDRFTTASRFHRGIVLLSASVTVLILQPLSTAPMPMMWIVPAFGVAASIAWMIRS